MPRVATPGKRYRWRVRQTFCRLLCRNGYIVSCYILRGRAILICQPSLERSGAVENNNLTALSQPENRMITLNVLLRNASTDADSTVVAFIFDACMKRFADAK